MTAYTPPIPGRGSLSFSGLYTPPLAGRGALSFGSETSGQTIAPVGFSAGAYGTPAVTGPKTLLPVSIGDTLGMGHPSLKYGQLFLSPSGFDASDYGRPYFELQNRPIFPDGWDAFGGWGTAWVSLGTRRLYAGLGDQSAFGTAVLAGGVRWIDLAGRGIDSLSVPAPTAWFRVRELFPAWFVATLYGSPLMDFNHSVLPGGFGGEQFGQAEVYRPRFLVDLAGRGMAGPAWGQHRVDLHTQFIAPPGWLDGGATEAERFGRPSVYNLTQYVEQLFEVGPDDGGAFGDFNYVENRNKVVRTEGILPGRFGVATVFNNARIITGAPFVEFTLWGSTLVAPAIRTLGAIGADTSAWGSPLGNIIYNAARVLGPAAIAPGAVGQPQRIWSNQQTIKALGTDLVTMGTAMVDFAVRTVAPYSLPEPPPFGNTTVQLLQRPVAPKGIEASGAGVPTLEIHFTIIGPKSVLPPANAFGDAQVRNKTPELHSYGWTATEWGGAALHNQFERYAFDGWDSQIFGAHVVKDRRQLVQPGGINSLAIANRHEVRKVTPDPPPPQTIIAAGWDASGGSPPKLRTNVLYPEGDGMGSFGQPTVVSNGILPRGITPPYNDSGTQFGVPSFNGTPILRPKGIAAPDDPLTSPLTTLPDVGPRYVWAPRGYPYATGYWTERGQQMDESVHGINHPERPVFGDPVVTHRNRTLAPRGDEHLDFGSPRLGLNPQYVRGSGTRFQKFGYPVLNGGGALGAYGFDMSRYGLATVVIADYGPKTLGPAGIDAGTFGAAEVQNFNRELLATGWDSFTISPPAPPSWPRESHWVSNAYAPFPFAGSDHAAFGTAWISHYTRFIEPQGWESDVLDYSPGSFRDRMRVSKARSVGAMAGFDASAFGTATVGNAWTGARVLGFSGFAFGLVNLRLQNRVHPAGFDALEVGDVQRWEAGKVKPYGDDMAAVGRAVLSRALHPGGMSGAFGTPSIGRPVAPGSISAPDDQVPVPVAIARWCGNKAMAVEGFDALNMGEVTIV